MKKTLKTIISILAVICLMATSFTVFADEAATEDTATTVTITTDMYFVSSTGTTKLTGVASTSFKNANIAIYVLPLPTLEPGKKIDSYIFKHYTNVTATQYIKIPQYDINSEDFLKVTTTTEGFAGKTGVQINAGTTNSAAVKASTYETVGTDPTYRQTVDLTKYVNDCINAGAKNYVLLGANHWGTTHHMYVPSSSKLSNQGLYTTYTYTTADADPLALTASSPADGDSSVASSSPVTFTFNNPLEEATATVNGEAAECTIAGATVTVNASFNQYSDYTVGINATDIYNQTLSQTISFKTGAKIIVNETKPDITAKYITTSAPTAPGKGGSDVDLRYNRFILYKVKLPQVDAGLIDSYKITYCENSADVTAKSSFFKLPGDAWDLSTITVNDDAVKAIIDSLKANGWASEYYAQDSESVYDVSKTLAIMPLCTGDVTSYVRECLANNQEYMYLGITSLASTQSAHGTDSYYYNPTISYGIIDPTFKTIEEVKIVASDAEDYYDAEGLTALVKGSSYKAIASITNKTADNMTVVIAIADYNGDTLESVSLKTVEVKSGAYEKLIESEAITAASTSTTAKAFLWNAAGNAPFGRNVEVPVQ